VTGRRMVTLKVTHDGGWIEEISTDDPKLLGEWLIYATHKMPERERGLHGNWDVRGWVLPG